MRAVAFRVSPSVRPPGKRTLGLQPRVLEEVEPLLARAQGQGRLSSCATVLLSAAREALERGAVQEALEYYREIPANQRTTVTAAQDRM